LTWEDALVDVPVNVFSGPARPQELPAMPDGARAFVVDGGLRYARIRGEWVPVQCDAWDPDCTCPTCLI
jgi:hypothetical protein